MQLEDKILSLKIIVGPVKITILPAKLKPKAKKLYKKEHKARRLQSKKQNTITQDHSGKKKKKEKKKNKIDLPFIFQLIHQALYFLSGLRRRLIIQELDLNIKTGGKDPETAAITYGRICAGIGSIVPIMNNVFDIRKNNIRSVYCPCLQEMEIQFRFSAIFHVGQLLCIGIFVGWKILWIYLRHKKSQKVGHCSLFRIGYPKNIKSTERAG